MKKVFGIIYLITNKINGKMYVGQTVNRLHWRIKEHFLNSKGSYNYFQNSLKKYGRKNFYTDQIDQAYSRKELNNLEIYWINKLDTINSGYNTLNGGQSTKFKDYDSRAKMSEKEINSYCNLYNFTVIYESYKNCRFACDISCNDCGAIVSAKIKTIKKYVKCKNCLNNRKEMKLLEKKYNKSIKIKCNKFTSQYRKTFIKKWYLDTVVELLKQNNIKFLSKEFNHTHDYYEYECSKGHKFTSRFNNVRRSLIRYNSTCTICQLTAKRRMVKL